MKSELYFQTPEDLYEWFKEHHHNLNEQWIGFYKVGTGVPSISWPESVDMALCFGWIDGVRYAVDKQRYKIRFTPRRPKSKWSDVNIAKVEKLIKEGKMTNSGLAVYGTRPLQDNEIFNIPLDDPSLICAEWSKSWKNSPEALVFFNLQPAGYRKQLIRWIISAKREETRCKRINRIIHYCQGGKRMPFPGAPKEKGSAYK